MLLRPIAALTVLGAFLPVSAQLRPRFRYAITAEQVAAKLVASFTQQGLALDPRQVSLPANLTSTEEAPALEIRAVASLGALHGERADSISSAVKVACASNRICLPFYAVVTVPGGGQLNPRGTKGALIAPDLPMRQEVVIRSGAHVRFVVDSGTAHIQMSVVTMENGALNQEIRVRSADHKQVYTAKVLDAGTVRGSL